VVRLPLAGQEYDRLFQPGVALRSTSGYTHRPRRGRAHTRYDEQEYKHRPS
jgi:hypothetical protein